MPIDATGRSSGRSFVLDGYYRLEMSEDGMIHAHIANFWTVEIFESYGLHLRQLFALSRDHFGAVRLIIDATSAPVQNQEMAPMLQKNAPAFEPGDKVAIIVGGHLAKLQAQRISSHPGARVFLSEDSARSWISAS